MSYKIRPLAPDDFTTFMRAEGAAFGARPTDAEIEERRGYFEFDYGLAAFDEARLVGTAAAYSFELTLPGGAILAAPGVSWVAVLPTHRRRGILTALMRRQLDELRERGASLAMLTASESTIYGRFGYGLATSTVSFELDALYGRLAREWEFSGRVRLLEHEQALETLPAFYDRLRRLRPGMLSRGRGAWTWLLGNPLGSADGYGPRFYLAYESASGQIEGTAHYRIKPEWTNGLPGGALTARDILAATPEAYAALWRYFLGVDLIRTVRAIGCPVDDPLRWLLADSRRLRITALTDDLWLRLLDIPAALAARTYGTRDRLVVEITDPFCPESAGRYALEGGPEGAECARTTAAPDLALAVADLGATYLGGVQLSTLAQAGRVEELRPGALRRADALFASEVVPYSGTPF